MKLLSQGGPPVNHCDHWVETRWGTVRARVLGQPHHTTVLTIPDPPSVLEHQQIFLEDLARDYRVIAFESPGFGYSKAARDYKFTLDQNAEVILQVLENFSAANATLALTCVSVLAGLVAAQLRPDLIGCLVLAQAGDLVQQQQWAKRVDFQGILGTKFVGQWFMRFAKKWVARHWYEIALCPGLHPQGPFTIAADSFNRGAQFSLASAFQALQREPADRNLQVPQRAIVLWGASDRTHQKTNKQSILRYLPNADFRELKNCSHCPDLELPREFAACVREISPSSGN